MANTNLAGFLNQMNNNQVRTQTMFALDPHPADPSILNLVRHTQVYGQGFTVPNRTNDFVNITYRGYEVPIPTVLKMEQDHNCTINCDTRMNLRNAFLMWQADQINPVINQGSYFESDRRPTRMGNVGLESYFDIDLLAPDYQTIVEQIRLHGVRVMSVGSITLSNTDGGVATFEVGFKSVYWENADVDNLGEVAQKAIGTDNGLVFGYSTKLSSPNWLATAVDNVATIANQVSAAAAGVATAAGGIGAAASAAAAVV